MEILWSFYYLPSCILACVCVLFVSLCSCDSSSLYRMYVTLAFPWYIQLSIVCFDVFVMFLFFHITHICQTEFPTFFIKDEHVSDISGVIYVFI